MAQVFGRLDQVAWLAQHLCVLLAVVRGLVEVIDVVEVEALGVRPWVCVLGERLALRTQATCLRPLPQPAGL